MDCRANPMNRHNLDSTTTCGTSLAAEVAKLKINRVLNLQLRGYWWFLAKSYLVFPLFLPQYALCTLTYILLSFYVCDAGYVLCSLGFSLSTQILLLSRCLSPVQRHSLDRRPYVGPAKCLRTLESSSSSAVVVWGDTRALGEMKSFISL